MLNNFEHAGAREITNYVLTSEYAIILHRVNHIIESYQAIFFYQ